eukprot:XP_011678022.1 PREDICTED: zinc finger protein 558-like [Strongylocentrotus purpuratus]
MQEFFHCLFSALLDPDLHIFRKIDDHAVSSNVWFNPEYLDYSTLEKIGLLFALLIFNEAVTTVPFPEQLYEKLLSNRDPEAIDLEKMDQGFVKQLREIEAENVEALDLDFEELRPGDENVPVTKENLELYIKEKMTKRLAIPQLAAFTKGFNRLASMTPLMKTIFKAEDLRDVILGEELDWNAFRLSVYYLDPYCEDHKVIKMFWKVFDEFEENDKRQFLKFLTCADHVPVGGFVRFPVRRLDNKADKYLDPDEPNKYPEPGNLMPEVMTCKDFLSMDLPEYETEEDLRFRLKMAIETRGFHLEVEAPPCVSATAIIIGNLPKGGIVDNGQETVESGMSINSGVNSIVISAHIEKPYECCYCKKGFSQKSVLNQHILIHTGEKPYECCYCKKGFSQKSVLNRHKLSHTGEKPHECSHCNKGFSEKRSLTQHLLTHTGEKPYECSNCKKGFSEKISLAQHLLTHTGEKPYECSYCKKRFSKKSNLTQHLLTHTGEKPYECSHCTKRFSLKSTLKRHLRTHTGEKPYECSNCKKGFSQKRSITQHLLTHRGEKP